MVEENAAQEQAAVIDASTSRFIIIALGITLIICVAGTLVAPLVGVSMPSVVGERAYNLAQIIVTGLFALFSPLAAQALVKK